MITCASSINFGSLSTKSSIFHIPFNSTKTRLARQPSLAPIKNSFVSSSISPTVTTVALRAFISMASYSSPPSSQTMTNELSPSLKSSLASVSFIKEVFPLSRKPFIIKTGISIYSKSPNAPTAAGMRQRRKSIPRAGAYFTVRTVPPSYERQYPYL